MGKTTQIVKTYGLVFAFFSFLLLSASTPTPTKPIIAEKESKEIAVAKGVTVITSTTDIYVFASTPTPIYGEIACIFSAPGEITETTSYDGTGNCSAVLGYIGTATAVGCDELTAKPFVNDVQIDPSVFEFPLDTTVVEWRAEDPLTGVIIKDNQLVIINDDEAPTVLTQPFTVELDDSGSASILPSDVDNGSYDNCAIDSYSLNNSTFSCSDIGYPVTVQLTVTDKSGNSNSAPATVTVVDNAAPTVITHSVTVPLGADGTATITPDQVDNGSYDNCGISSKILNINNFSCINVGAPVTVELTATDASGNSDSKPATVTLVDNAVPSVLTKNITVQLDANGNASIAENAVDNGSSDNDTCGTLSFDTDVTTFTCEDLGDNTVNLTVTDASGNSDFAPAVVTVEDNIPPNVVTKDISVQLDANGTASITAADIDNGSTDACGIISRTLDVSSFDCNDIGANTVTLNVTDINGQVATGTATVTVEDNVAPTVVTEDITVQLDASGNATITTAQIDNGSSDACGIASMSLDKTTFDCTNIGPNPVTLTVTDVNGKTATGTATVTVEDNVAPSVVTQNITVLLNSAGNASITAAQVDDGSSDTCGIASISLDKTSFDCTNIGANSVTLTVTDVNGKTATGTATVTVEDNTYPTLTTPLDITNAKTNDDSTGNCGTTVNLGTPSVADNCGVFTVKAFVSGSEIDPQTYSFPIGTTEVMWVVTDNHNNSNSESQFVTIVDNELPQITAPGKVTVDTDTASCSATGVVLGNATATDNCTSSANISITNNAPTSFPLGNTTVTWRAEDEAGNYTEAFQTVTVEDNEIPTITAPANVTGRTSNDGTGDCFTVVNLGSPTVSDNCTTPTVKAYVNGSGINPSTHLFPKGTTTVTWEVTDGNNNIATDVQEVTIQDDEAPVIVSPSPITAYTSQDGRGNCSTTALIGFPSISDNCNTVSTKAYIDSTEINPELYEFPVGETTVTWIATDARGLTSSADQVVTVIDDEDPVPRDLNTINWGCAFTVPTPTATDNCDTSITVTANRATTFTSSGTIIWTFTDDQGNSSTASQQVNISPISATVSASRTTAYGKNDGTAIVNPSGGVAPYTYKWRQIGNSTIISSAKEATFLAAGSYEVTVKDMNGCSIIQPVEVISAVLPAHISSSACYDVHDYIRTSTFEVDLNNVTGGEGDPDNFIYEWNFGLDATPNSATGTQEHTVTWDSSGDKVVYLSITDESGYKQSFPIDHYVGGCFEGCGATSNFVMNTNNFFIGDEFGNPLTGDNCATTTDKYMWIDITDNANGYALSAEMNYAVNNGEETITGKAIGCFSEVIGHNTQGEPIYDKIPTGLFRLFKVQETGNATDMITWQCGSTFRVEGINIRWTNQDTRGCNEGTKPMCYGPDTEVIVKTPLVVDATPEDILCKEESTGSIAVHAAGGLKPYKYSLLDGPVTRPYQDSEHFYNLPAGEYIYSAKDADTIITTGTVIISEPDTKVDASVEVTSQITCYGGTGSAKVTVSPTYIGTPPYTYSWSSGHTGDTADSLLAGITYTVTVTDANNCSVTKTIILTQPPQLTRANAGADASFGCGITATTLGANSPAAGEKGTWSIVSGTGGSITSTDLNDANAPFTGVAGETYVLQWTISKTDDSCSNNDTVSITFAEKCSTLNFDGIDDHVIIGDHYDFSGTDFTLEAWVRPKSVNGTKTILSKRNTGDMASGGYDLNITNGVISFRWNNNKVYSTHQIGTDRWYHVAVLFSAGTPKIYVDGILLPLQYDISVSGNPAETGYPFMIGGANYMHTPSKPKNLFHGWIEEVRIWKTALSEEQLRFMMNQRVELAADGASVKGEILPMNVPGNLLWSDLSGYYRLKVTEIDEVNGTTPDIAPLSVPGNLRNIEEEQENSAPLPYISVENIPDQTDSWWNKNSWLYPDYWDVPNSTGINGERIEWNIAWVSDTLHSGNRDITLLGLLLKSGKLDMLGTNPTSVTQAGTGNGLIITKYLDLDGFIDLNGESQLVQPEGSILVGSGRLDRDQQGTGSSYNYNYFSSPVSTGGNEPNSGYTVKDVLRSGTDPVKPDTIHFNYQYHFADGPLSDPLKISTYWLYKFHGKAGEYNQWHWVGQNNHLDAGEGYTMKGSSGHLDILDLQNYVFTGMPNNGPIKFTVGTNENRLIGNPYPSAIDADKFIEDNLKNSSGDYIFNGTLYFWSHFKGKTHYLTRYEGGYAMYNLMGSARAVANDARINATGEIGGMEPRQFIPPGQAFFINTLKDDEIPDGTTKLPLPVGMVGGEISFGNSQRVFQREDPAKAVFHSKEKPQMGTSKETEEEVAEKDTRKKIWLKSRSPLGYHRQLLIGADSKTTMNFDPGYDAPLHDVVDEDIYWKLKNMELVIQGVPDFHKEIELPLEVKTKHEGEFTIEIDKLVNIPDDFAILLKDTLDNELHDLRASEFKFNAMPGIINDRFSIVFLNEKKEPEEIPDAEETVNNVDLLFSREESTVNIFNPDLVPMVKASLYDLNGQHLRHYDYVPTEKLARLAIPLLSQGVYLLRLETANETSVLKFIID